MPRVSGSKDYVSLAQGLITEASPLSFPENATADEQIGRASCRGRV